MRQLLVLWRANSGLIKKSYVARGTLRARQAHDPLILTINSSCSIHCRRWFEIALTPKEIKMR